MRDACKDLSIIVDCLIAKNWCEKSHGILQAYYYKWLPMKLDQVSVTDAMNNAKAALAEDKTIATATKLTMELLITITDALISRLHLNSSNSSKPPSTDPNRKKKTRNKSNKPKGGQNGHNGTTLKPIEDPDEIVELTIDKKQLPVNNNYIQDGYIARQVVDIKISRFVTEYRAEILIDNIGNQYIAEFPADIVRPIQYGYSVKAHAVYLSTYQLIPYERTQEQFSNEYNIPISQGSIFNFNTEAATLVAELFEPVAKQVLANAAIGNVDETGINVNSKRFWLHNFSNEEWTWLEPHGKRGLEAMNDIGIIAVFNGVLCHDHWKPYFNYDCAHSLCNAHHLRELTFAAEEDKQKWAEEMRLFLIELSKEVDATSNNKLSKKKAVLRREAYRKILDKANIECPESVVVATGKKTAKQSKSRNLLNRLQEYENEVLRFMEESLVPFTNNQGERDLRMFKVQQKISGCFRSMEGAINFCKVRSYLSTCDKHGVSATEALELLFKREMPDFVKEQLNNC